MRDKVKSDKGITLVALIVTMIILIILIAVVIGYVEDDNGLIRRAEESIDIYDGVSKNENDFLYAAETLIGGNIPFSVNPDAYTHEDQSKTNKDRGIDKFGKPVNMDLWLYQVIDEDRKLIELSCEQTSAGFPYPAYVGGFTRDGKIEGEIPQYIKIDGKGVYTVTSLYFTFRFRTELKIPPAIPDTVESMVGAFYMCTSLEMAPIIPNNVKNLDYTFHDCSKLKEAPVIPNGVTSLFSTFFECSELKEAPVIPENVICIDDTFRYCSSLIGDIVIKSPNVEKFDNFITVYQNNKITIKVPENSSTYNLLNEKYGSSSSATIETFSVN